MADQTDLTRFRACEADEIEDCEALQVEVPGRAPVAVYRVGDDFYATDDTCTHGNASLADGDVDEECIVECPFHAGTFDIRTGKALSLPCTVALKTYPVTVADGVVYLDLEGGATAAG